MTCYYLDTSALVKRYVNETGSRWLREIVAPEQTPLLFTSRMTIIEVISAFTRRVRDGSLAHADFALARDAFRSDCLNDYQIIPPTIAVVDQACHLLEQYPLRAYDATHLATALSVQTFLAKKNYPALTFLSADQRLNHAAATEDLVVDDPNRH